MDREIFSPSKFAAEVEKHFHGDWPEFIRNSGGATHLRYLLREVGAWELLAVEVQKDINRRVMRLG